MAELPPSIEQAVQEDTSPSQVALEKLERELKCTRCKKLYGKPKLLRCFHVFCEKCLEPEGQAISCPNPKCGQPTPLPENGVPGLPGAFYIQHLLDIRDTLQKVSSPAKTTCSKCKKRDTSCFCHTCGFLCERCKDVHTDWEEFSHHEIISLGQLAGDMRKVIPPFQKTLQCSKHQDKQRDLYCETCEELVCRDCTIRLHRDHQYDLVGDAFPRHKDVIIASLQPVEQQLATVSKALEGLDVRCGQITKQRKAIETEIHHRIEQLKQTLEKREKDLISQLEQVTSKKLKSLATQKEQIELEATRLKSCCDFVQESLQTGSKGEILAMKKSVVEEVKEITKETTAEFRPESLTPEEKADVKFIHCVAELSEACQQFGVVYIPQACPAKCHAAGPGTRTPDLGKMATATVQIVDQEGMEYDCPVEVSCELVSSDGSSQSRGEVKRKGQNGYEICYHPQRRGYHQLQVQVEGRHISRSPFVITVVPSTPTRMIRGLIGPRGVVVNEREQVIIAETSGHCISIFDVNGRKIRSFGSKGSAPGQLDTPCLVALTATGDILVCDAYNNRIQQFSPEGKLVKCVGPLQLSRPMGIAVHPCSHKIYVTDYVDHCVHILNANLTFSGKFGSRGIGNGQFMEPYGISVNSAGDVFVADRDNHRIQVFTDSGVYIRQFGRWGGGEGELCGPTGLAIDSNDIVYICERGSCRVSLFTHNGRFLRSFGTPGEGPGQFTHLTE